MISCTIEEVLENNRYRLNPYTERYPYMLMFNGIDKPSKGDQILIHESLLDLRSPWFCQPYIFEIVQGEDPKKIKKLNDREYVIVKIENKIYVLKRIYG